MAISRRFPELGWFKSEVFERVQIKKKLQIQIGLDKIEISAPGFKRTRWNIFLRRNESMQTNRRRNGDQNVGN